MKKMNDNYSVYDENITGNEDAGAMLSSQPAEPPAEGRVAWFDNLKFLLIVLVVTGHYIDPFAKITPVWGSVFFFIYLFHMPVFIFITGFFAKSMADDEGRFNYGRVLSFLVLYLILNTGIFVIERYLGGADVLWRPWEVSNASWYLLACCIWFLLIPLVRHATPGVAIVVSSAAALGAGYAAWLSDIFALARVVNFAPFFLMGFYMDKETLLNWRMKKTGLDQLRAFAILLALLVAVILASEVISGYRGILTGRNQYAMLGALEPFGALFRLGQIIVAVFSGYCLMVLTPFKKRFFTKFGGDTLQVYVWHLWILRLLGCISLVSLTEGWISQFAPAVALPLALAVAVTFICSFKPPFGLISGMIMKAVRLRLSIRKGFVLIPALLLLMVAGLPFVLLSNVDMPFFKAFISLLSGGH